jgi:DnaJ domain
MRDYYRTLDIRPDATQAEIKDAWNFSVKAFHPDKFAGSSHRQQGIAHERTKAINEAYSVLSDPIKRANYDREYKQRTGTKSAAASHSSPPPARDTATAGPNSPPPQWTPPRQSPQSVSRKPKSRSWFWGPAGRPRYAWVLYLGFAIAAVLFVLAYLPTPPVTQRPQNTSPRRSDIFEQLAESRESPPGPWLAFQSPNRAIASPTLIEIRRAEPVNPTPIEIRRAKPLNEPRPQSPYFTIGSTKNDVLRIQGSPDSFTDNMFWYGTSFVGFQGDRVVSWSNGFLKLKAQLLPRPGTNAPPFFTVGSSKDEVLAVQGTPDSFTDNMFWYGTSFVGFQGDRVVSWSNGFPKLKAFLRPSTP